MKSTLLIILLSCLGLSQVNAGDFSPPDYKAIRKNIKDKKSAFYYPTLMKRYKNGDTTFTKQEFATLYYGFLFDPGYSVLDFSTYNDSINVLLRADSMVAGDNEKMIRYEKAILETSPFRMRDLNRLANAYYYDGDTVAMRIAGYKLQMIAATILSTGDGRTDKTGWHVISVGHEYDILNFMGFDFGGSQKLTHSGCDYLDVEKNKEGIKGFYFDVKQILEKEAELLKLK
ncbi:DUF4919 domain-containing protein [Taibaiella chishuiensis]|uniref:Uncharacterized protein DUF4919 n=1 Tax=Taibaiella chishuiensis TaxID=1434707 RepID=A0A2P8D1M2_9BACT|nr:DUF4919 domain-containing protein [Taibaiella chishuiensis]PSK91109.1 uncharacterized protein DUF4919 [Taibaiella chishuiensis]